MKKAKKEQPTEYNPRLSRSKWKLKMSREPEQLDEVDDQNIVDHMQVEDITDEYAL